MTLLCFPVMKTQGLVDTTKESRLVGLCGREEMIKTDKVYTRS